MGGSEILVVWNTPAAPWPSLAGTPGQAARSRLAVSACNREAFCDR
jgi:hypothetical protein